MDIYRVTTVDPSGRYRSLRREVRYGTKRKAAAIAKAVRLENASRRRYASRRPGRELVLVDLTVEIAPAASFIDVTDEFAKAAK